MVEAALLLSEASRSRRGFIPRMELTLHSGPCFVLTVVMCEHLTPLVPDKSHFLRCCGQLVVVAVVVSC